MPRYVAASMTYDVLFAFYPSALKVKSLIREGLDLLWRSFGSVRQKKTESNRHEQTMETSTPMSQDLDGGFPSQDLDGVFQSD